ncbi:helix-turn-helix domain-containing protein [Microvirga massiliensis]|uniref:helix-turn-helix domain-containing protein n=1 Tax=Microvirga massiliensis TaxID=1033741 RepID=UPI003CC7CFD6
MQWARIVLSCTDGLGTAAVARRLQTSQPTARLWRERYRTRDVVGLLKDASRPPARCQCHRCRSGRCSRERGTRSRRTARTGACAPCYQPHALSHRCKIVRVRCVSPFSD